MFPAKSLCFPCSSVPLFPRNVSQPRCSPNLYYSVLIFPSTHVSPNPKSLCFPVSMFSSLYVPHSRWLPSPYVPQSLCPRPQVPMFPNKDVPISLCSPSLNSTVMTPLIHRSVFHSLCSPNMFPSPYVLQWCPAVPMLPSPFPSVPQQNTVTLETGNIETGEHLGSGYIDWGTSALRNIFGNIGTGNTLGNIGTGEQRLGSTGTGVHLWWT